MKQESSLGFWSLSWPLANGVISGCKLTSLDCIYLNGDGSGGAALRRGLVRSVVLNQGYSPHPTPPKRHLAIPGDNSGCHRSRRGCYQLPVCGWNTGWCQATKQRIIRPNVSRAKAGDPGLSSVNVIVWRHCVECRASDTSGHVLCDPFCVRCPELANPQRREVG